MWNLIVSVPDHCLSFYFEFDKTKYWIPQERSAVRKVVRTCTLCQRYEGGPFKIPLMPPMSTARVASSAPFLQTQVFTNLDLFTQQLREKHKRYGFIYTSVW